MTAPDETTDAPPRQLRRSELRGMTADAIVAAKASGQLDDLLGVNGPDAQAAACEIPDRR